MSETNVFESAENCDQNHGDSTDETYSIPKVKDLYQTDDDSNYREETEESQSDLSESDALRLSDDDENWSATHCHKLLTFSATPGLKVKPFGDQAIDYFNLIFGYDFLNSLATDINRRQKKLHKESSDAPWEELSILEVRTFIALLLHLGTAFNFKDMWSQKSFYNVNFREIMVRKRFLAILKGFQFGRVKEPCGRLQRLGPLLEYFNKTMERVYYPGRLLSMNEPLVVFEDRIVSKSYFDRKQSGESVKYLHSLIEPNSGIILRFAIPTRKGCEGHVSNIVLRMLSGLLNSGHSVYLDKFYINVELAYKLLELNTYCTGYIKSCGKGLPRKLLDSKLKNKDFKLYHCKGVTVLKKSNSDYLLTSEHGKDLKTKKNVKSLLKFNSTLKELSIEEVVSKHYPRVNKVGWYLKIVVHIFQIMLHNSYALFRVFSRNSMSRGKYRKAVLEELLRLSTDVSEGTSSESEFDYSLGASSLLGQ